MSLSLSCALDFLTTTVDLIFISSRFSRVMWGSGEVESLSTRFGFTRRRSSSGLSSFRLVLLQRKQNSYQNIHCIFYRLLLKKAFQPVLHDWCNKGCGMCYPVCGVVHIKEPLLLIRKSSLCGGSVFPFTLSEWSLIICLTPYNRK